MDGDPPSRPAAHRRVPALRHPPRPTRSRRPRRPRDRARRGRARAVRAAARDVLIAERLHGRPLDADHGAPARLVSPRQHQHQAPLPHRAPPRRAGRHPGRPPGQPGRAARAAHHGPSAGAGLGGGAPPVPPAPVAAAPVPAHDPVRRPPRPAMRLPDSVHTARPWRIHALMRDFRLEDVWALPMPGGPDDLPRLLHQFAAGDPSRSSSTAVRTLLAIRWRLGALLETVASAARTWLRSRRSGAASSTRRCCARWGGAGAPTPPRPPTTRTRRRGARRGRGSSCGSR
jgi:hypothetical protein